MGSAPNTHCQVRPNTGQTGHPYRVWSGSRSLARTAGQPRQCPADVRSVPASYHPHPIAPLSDAASGNQRLGGALERLLLGILAVAVAHLAGVAARPPIAFHYAGCAWSI